MSVAVQSAMSIDFLDALGRLPRHQQKGARSLVSKFTRNPTSPGLNYETIHGAKDSQMRSLKIDKSYRAIVHGPVEGNTYMLLRADKHDEAYRSVFVTFECQFLEGPDGLSGAGPGRIS